MTATDIQQENSEGVIDLPESFPVVRFILKFLYTSDYDAPAPYLMHQLQVYVAADKYGIPALKATAARHALAYLDAAACSYKRMTAPDLRAMTVSGIAFSTVIEYVYGTHLMEAIFCAGNLSVLPAHRCLQSTPPPSTKVGRHSSERHRPLRWICS